MRDDRAHPAGVDLGRPDEGEECPDLGHRLTADVLPRPRPEGVVEGCLLGVHVEVDRLGLRDAEGGLGRLDALLGDRECPGPERFVTLVPVDPNERADLRPPVEPGVRVEDRSGRARLRRGTERQPPSNGELRVREEVAVGDLERVMELLGAGPGRRQRPG